MSLQTPERGGGCRLLSLCTAHDMTVSSFVPQATNFPFFQVSYHHHGPLRLFLTLVTPETDIKTTLSAASLTGELRGSGSVTVIGDVSFSEVISFMENAVQLRIIAFCLYCIIERTALNHVPWYNKLVVYI